MIEGADYFVRIIRFANRANKALACVNDDGTYDIYLNSMYDTGILREALTHELRHLERGHFDLDMTIRRIEAQADGEPLDLIGAAKERGNIIVFHSPQAFGNYIKRIAAQRNVDLAKADIRKCINCR